MIRKGQIVEIPATSVIYTGEAVVYSSKKEELKSKLQKRDYNLFDGFLVGEHQGVDNFKLGQRKGINVGGKSAPLYVIGINETNNQLFVGEGEKHPGLWTNVICFNKNQINLESLDLIENDFEKGIDVTVRSSVIENAIPATLYIFDKVLFLELEEKVSISLQDHPLEIKFKHNNTRVIKIN